VRQPDGVKQKASRAPRVFLGLTEIAGYYANLQRGLHELGFPATLVALDDHPFKYAASEGPLISRCVKWLVQRRQAVSASARQRRLFWIALEGCARLALLGWALCSFDVFVLGFGTTFLGLPGIELRLMRAFGKRIICVFHGSDSRPAYLDGALMAPRLGRTDRDCARLVQKAKARVSALDRFADYVIDHPLAAHLHERTCVQWLAIGVPGIAMPEGQLASPAIPDRRHGAVRILHAPSDPEVKGTSRIRQSIDNLRARGHAIEFVEIVGKPHADVQSELRKCDLVVDQLYSDTPMAGFAAEAAAYGKPTVVGGYGMQALSSWICSDDWPPTAYCHPDELEQTMERLIVDGDYRTRLGRQAKQFVEDRWSPGAVAGRFQQMIEGSVPRTWLFDPRDLRYVHGGGVSEERARELIAGVLQVGGRGALQVGDKPELERMLIEFAESGSMTSRRGVMSCSR